MAEPPYRLSRAALRNKYGSRSIDASANQSARDDTPSGRAKRLEQGGYNEKQIDRLEDVRWDKRFAGKEQPIQPIAEVIQGEKPVAPVDPNAGLDAQISNIIGQSTGPMQGSWTQAAFNPKQSLLPEAIGDPSAMLEFLPPPDPTIGRAPVFAPRKKSYGSSLFGGSSLFT